MFSTPARPRVRNRIVAIATTAALAMSGAVLTTAPASAAVTPIFTDAPLNTCVKDALGPTLATLLDTLGLGFVNTLVNTLTGALTCSGLGITDLEGLANLTKLSDLDLSGNVITDVTDLAGLVDLNSLDLSGNGITDLSVLSGLTDTVIDATDQVIDLGDVVAGQPVVLPVITGLTGALAPITDAAGGVVGVIDTATGTVTFLTDGVGELTFQIGSLAGTIVATVTNDNFGDVSASIAGTTEFGQTLTAVPAGYATDATYSYVWKADGATTATTTSTYVLGASDIGKRFTVTVTGHKAGFNDKSATSDESHTIRSGTISSAPTPTISGTTSVGSTLTVTPGSWSPGVALSYQWYRSGISVAGATATSYALTAADLGKTITVAVRGSKANYTTVTRTSAPTVAITAETTPDSSQNGTNTGTNTGTNSGTTTGTTLKTFKKVYATKIKGTAKVGKKLTAVTSKWSKKVKFGYQWKANGKKIAKATGKTWKVTKKYAGKKITVQITAKLSGYKTFKKTSGSTKKVRV